MTRICLLHPDKAVREALVPALQAAWPSATIDAAQSADDAAQDTLFLALGTMDAPAVRTIFFNTYDTPPFLKQLVQDLQQLERRLEWPEHIQLGGYAIDTLRRTLTTPEKNTVNLTEKEIGILMYLYRKQSPATRDDLLRDVWSYASDVDTHTIETHIYRLRQKIETNPEQPEILLTTKEGYQLAAFSNA